MGKILRSIVAIIIMVGIIYVVTNYSGLIKQQIGVKGDHTDRAHEISQQINGDIKKQVDTAKDQAMQVKVQDVADFFTRFQKIPQDVTNAKAYVQEQVTNVFKGRDKKE